MKITGISVWQLSLPLRSPYWLSGGRLKFEVLDSTILRLDTDQGLHGWGEGCPWGVSYLPAFGAGIRAGIAELAPAVIGLDPRQLDHLNRRLDLALPGHPYIKSAIDMACWDILGKSASLPVCALLGAREPCQVPVASSISTGTPQKMLDDIQGYRDRGFRVHSAKIGADIDRDIERINFLMQHKLAGETIYFDSNRAWLPREAITVMNAVDRVDSWFEQPCETLEQTRLVRQSTRQPILVDESLHDFTDLLKIHDQRICEMVNIKVNRVGGLTRARRMRDFCLETGISMLIMDTGGSVIADTAAAHLAQSTPAPFCLGSWSCQDMVTVDPAPGQGARPVDGYFAVPEQPGLGVEPDLALLGEPLAVYR